MKTFTVLVGNADGRVTSLIESLVRKICHEELPVDFLRTSRVDQFVQAASGRHIDLVLLNPEALLPRPGRPVARLAVGEMVSALRTVKSARRAPLIALAVSEQNLRVFTEAGADAVLGLPFNCLELQRAVKKFLPDPPPREVPVRRASLFEQVVRGWQRLVTS
jgi:CheY-like chemotaxis protein